MTNQVILEGVVVARSNTGYGRTVLVLENGGLHIAISTEELNFIKPHMQIRLIGKLASNGHITIDHIERRKGDE